MRDARTTQYTRPHTAKRTLPSYAVARLERIIRTGETLSLQQQVQMPNGKERKLFNCLSDSGRLRAVLTKSSGLAPSIGLMTWQEQKRRPEETQ